LKRMNSFEDITPDREVVSLLTRIYKGNVDNVDAFVGGLAEPHVAGGAVGELFATIIADQFSRLRNGDRHWFENKAVAAEAVEDIVKYRRTTMAQVIARNSGLGEQDRVWDGHAGGASLSGAKGFLVPRGLHGKEREESTEL
jgi:peroxidase